MEGWWQTWTILAVLLVAGVRMAAADRGNLRDKFHSEVAGQLGVPPGGGAPPRPPPQESPDQTAPKEVTTPPESDFLVKPSEDSPPEPPSLPQESPKGNRKYDFKLEPAPAGFQPPPSFNADPGDLEAYFSNVSVDKYGVAGSPVAKNGAFRYPYLASLVLNSAHHCTATLIAPQILLTAAHCVHPKRADIKKMTAKFFRYKGGKEHPQTISIIKAKIHPQYRYNEGNNIALVKLANAPSNAKGARYMGQGDLDLDYSEKFVSLGWGRLSTYSAYAENLQEVYMPFVGQRRCARALRKKIPSMEFCAGMQGRGPCKGDDGGPLIRSGGKPENDMIVGITTNKVACGNSKKPDVFTRVSDFSGWILAEKDKL